jgi:hypothetical protein
MHRTEAAHGVKFTAQLESTASARSACPSGEGQGRNLVRPQFLNQGDGTKGFWFDIAFQYSPYWEKLQK